MQCANVVQLKAGELNIAYALNLTHSEQHTLRHQLLRDQEDLLRAADIAAGADLACLAHAATWALLHILKRTYHLI